MDFCHKKKKKTNNTWTPNVDIYKFTLNACLTGDNRPNTTSINNNNNEFHPPAQAIAIV